MRTVQETKRRNEDCFAERVLRFHEKLSGETFDLPEGFRVVNPFCGERREDAAATEAGIILMDEPTEGLDFAHKFILSASAR